jgi:hypothetical protein
MKKELRAVALPLGVRARLMSLPPAAAAARAAAASAHPLCPSQGTLTLLLGRGLVRWVMPTQREVDHALRVAGMDGAAGGGGGGTAGREASAGGGEEEKEEDEATEEEQDPLRIEFLDLLHRWCV